MLLPWLTRDLLYEPTLPNDDNIQYDMTVTETDASALSGVYVIPPVVMSDEDT